MTSRASDVHPSTHGLSLFLVLMFTLQLLAPVVSAAGMQSCGGGDNCDTYDHDEDLTPNVQDWVEGMYEFDLVSTSSIDLELTWAVREFDRDSDWGPALRSAIRWKILTGWTPTTVHRRI